MLKKILIFIVSIFLLNMNVNAACSYKEQSELNSKAANIKVSYELIEEEIGDIYEGHTEYYFNVTITNLTNEFYIVRHDSYTDKETTFRYTDTKDGMLTFRWDYATNVTNFRFEVYSSSETNCPDEKYKTIYETTPRYNFYSQRAICLDYPEFYLCQKFVTFNEVAEEREFLNQLNKYIKGEISSDGEEPQDPTDEPFTDKIFEFFDKYKWYFLGGIIIIVIGVAIVHRIRTKKQRELGL